MRIHEVIFWYNEPTKRANHKLDLPPASDTDDLTNLANAFTRRGVVKHFWNLNGSEGQPSELAPPDAETELIPNATLEPTTPPLPAEPVEEEPPVGLHQFMPTRQYGGVSGAAEPARPIKPTIARRMKGKGSCPTKRPLNSHPSNSALSRWPSSVSAMNGSNSGHGLVLET